MLPQSYFDLVKARFSGDVNATWTWFKSPNSELGMLSPLEALRKGRKDKVKRAIDKLVKR